MPAPRVPLAAFDFFFCPGRVLRKAMYLPSGDQRGWTHGSDPRVSCTSFFSLRLERNTCPTRSPLSSSALPLTQTTDLPSGETWKSSAVSALTTSSSVHFALPFAGSAAKAGRSSRQTQTAKNRRVVMRRTPEKVCTAAGRPPVSAQIVRLLRVRCSLILANRPDPRAVRFFSLPPGGGGLRRCSIGSGTVVAHLPSPVTEPRLLPLQPLQAEKIPYMSGVDLTIHSSTTSSSARRSIVGDRKSRGKTRAEGRPSLVGLPSRDGLFNGVNRMRWTTILSTLALL